MICATVEENLKKKNTILYMMMTTQTLKTRKVYHIVFEC